MATGVIRQSNHRFENLFFSGMAVLILATVFLGFARSYYLAGVFKAPLPNLIVHIHGAVFSSWILLLIAQTSLVATGRIDLHRRLGLLGFGLACLVVILGLLAATDSLARHFAAGEPGVGARAFYAIPIADMLVFSTLIYFAPQPLQSCRAQAAHPDRYDCASGCGLCPLAHSRCVVGSPVGADVLLPFAVVADRLRPVVHEKGSSRHALGQRVPDRAVPGANSNRANRPLAEFCHIGAESRPFFPLSAKTTGEPSSPVMR